MLNHAAKTEQKQQYCDCCLAGSTSRANLSLGSNVKLVDWVPQNDVLGHPAVKAFVTHAGVNSLYEAAYHAKPIVAVPLIADQPSNAAQASTHGCCACVHTECCQPAAAAY